MKKINMMLLTLITLFLATGVGYGQTVIDISDSDDPSILKTTLGTADEGATILLKRGMTYDLTATAIGKSVKIMSTAGSGAPANLEMGGSSLDVTGGSTIAFLTFEDVEVQGDFAAGYLMNFSSEGSIGDFTLENVYIHNLRGVFRCKNDGVKNIGTFNVLNSVVDSINGYGVMIMDNAASSCAAVNFTNSTFTNVDRVLRWRSTDDANSVVINKCTFYNTPMSGDFIRLDNAITNGVFINNSILSLSNNKLVNGTATVNASSSYKTADCALDGFAEVPMDYAGNSTDLFADAENGDLTIKDLAFEGLNKVGDPAWNPLKHSYTFDDGTANDMVGNLHGTVNGTKISIADGYATVSGAATPTDGYISLDAAALGLNQYSAITLEAYVKTFAGANGSYTMLCYFGNNTGGNKCLWYQPTRAGNESRAETNNGSATKTALLSNVELDDGKLHHVVVTLTAETLQYWLDGSLVSETATEGDYISTLDNQIANIFKGPNGWGDANYNVNLDEFNIYEGTLSAETIAASAEAYLSASDASIGNIESNVGELTPAFSSAQKSYGLLVPEGTTTVNLTASPKYEGTTITGDGDIDVSSGSATVTLDATSADESGTDSYTVYIKVDDHCYMPIYSGLSNLVSDPELTDIAMFGGWGNKSIVYGAEAYCGISSGRVSGNNGGSIDLLNTASLLKPNTTYILKAMVYAAGSGQCQIGIGGGILATDPLETRSTTNDQWEEINVTFTTQGTVPGGAVIYFNNYGLSNELCYIDNWQLFEAPSKVAYVTSFEGLTADGASDPIISMLQADENIDLTVIEHDANDTGGPLDLSMYAAVIAQEAFGSSSTIYKRGQTLGMGSIPVPFIHNKVYTMRDGRGFQDGATGSGGEVEGTLFIKVDPANQANELFNGITFDGDSVQLFVTGGDDNGGDTRTKGLQFATNVVISGENTLLASGVNDPAEATVCFNDIPAGDTIGSEVLQARMIAVAFNYGAMSKGGGNLTPAGLTLWRNAVYSLVGKEIPTEPVDNSVEIEVSVENGMVAQDNNAAAIQVTVPMGTTSVALNVDVISGIDAVIPTIDGLTDGTTTEYELLVNGVGTTVTYNVAVHVQAEGEILYLSASNGVYAAARKYDVNIYDALVDAGHSVTLLKRGGIFEWTPDGINAFDYTPYAGMVISAGEGSSNVNDFAKRNYPIPCVTMQPDGPRSDKFGWIGVKSDDDKQMNVTKAYDATTAQIKITNNAHPITEGYTVDQVITWTLGTPDSADWAGKEVKSYNLTDSIPDAIALATIPADGSSLTTMWAIPAGSSVRSMNGDYDTYERVTTSSNVVFMSVFNDGWLYAGPEGLELLLKALDWAMTESADFVQSDDEKGLVDIPAEDFSAYKAGSGAKEGDAWIFSTETEGFMGTGYMQSVMSAGDGDQNNAETINAKLTYTVEFVKTGTHYIWAYVYFPDGSSDSFWYGLNGAAQGRVMGSPYGAWKWASGENSFEVSETGIQTIDIMQREPNAIVDHIVITTDPNYDPSVDVKKVAYVTSYSGLSAEGAGDPIVAMLEEDANIDVTVIEHDANDTGGPLDLSMYDVVVAQEAFGSSSAIYRRGQTLGMGSIPVPFILNKVYTMRDGRGFQDGATGSGGEVAGTLAMKVDAANQANELFNAITFDGDTAQLFFRSGHDDGGVGTKGLQYATNVVISAENTLLGSGTNDPAEATVCLNDIPAGSTIGSETLQARMIAMAMNYGAICKDGGNLNSAGMTLWRNAIYSLAGLEVPTTPIEVDDPNTSVNQVDMNNGVTVYPNPASTFARVAFTLTENAQVRLTVYNTLGQKVHSNAMMNLFAGENMIELSTSDLNNGINIYQLEVGENTYQGKFYISK